MPVYEYECGVCGSRFEVIQKFSDPEVSVCKQCHASQIRKVLSPAAFLLKGSGWYATDYPSSDRKKAAESEKPTEQAAPKTGCQATCTAEACPSKK